MNSNTLSPPRGVDDRLLDRLVDNELAPADRAAVIAGLNADPDGWRRCAVAFLEAQAWRGALRDRVVESPAAVASPAVARMRIPRRGGVAAGLAAAFVVAFLAGFAARGGPGGGSSSETASERPYAMSVQASPSTQNVRPSVPAPVMEPWTAGAAQAPGYRVQLPLLTAESGAGSAALHQASALPEYVRKQLERQGYQVEGDRQVLSVALEDGRSVDVPVERLKYRYVGYRVH